MANAPLSGTGCKRCSLICISGKAKYFLFWDLTRFLKNRIRFAGRAILLMVLEFFSVIARTEAAEAIHSFFSAGGDGLLRCE
jgi:hypothetical protein